MNSHRKENIESYSKKEMATIADTEKETCLQFREFQRKYLTN